MAPPRRTSPQIDEISETLGRLSGQIEGLDRYTHEREHAIANLSQKVDGIGTQIAREVGRLKGEIQGEIKSFKDEIEKLTIRVTKLEAAKSEVDGAKSVWVQILQSPIIAGTIGGVLAALGMAWAFLSGHE